MKFIERLHYKHPNWGIENLMLHVSLITGIVYIMAYGFRTNIETFLYLDRAMIFQGQIWRLITFIFIPPTPSVIWIAFTLYFYYWIGTSLERTWGTFKFNAFYILSMLGTILAALVFGGAYEGFYVNLSMFLAFAYLYPQVEVMIFFFIPIKIKYLAYVDAGILLLNFILGSFTVKLSIIASLTGFLVFFGNGLYLSLKMFVMRIINKIKHRGLY
ncbi:MAG: rhomboid family intramembrane serine protease [Eubacteriaceae bacterium]|jgi:membrane associated rhomboid family serine protease|nr:rhomboid family intramembrane serine protease [Eubacteriaceae bacterium]